MSESLDLEIIKDDTVSINDLVNLRAEGFSVLRSAHVGNLAPYNMTLADAGIPILSVDHTITGIDKNYFPEMILTRASQKIICDSGRLVCRALVGPIARDIASKTNKPKYLDDVHVTAARNILGVNSIFTNTEYLRENESVAGEIVALGVKEFPGYFERIVTPSGEVEKRLGASALVGCYGILQLIDEPRAEKTAVLMPNILDILANFVIEYLETGRDVQYHLSGPDMIRYIDRLVPELNRFYVRLRRCASYGPKLPNKLTVRLVPTVDARFATTTTKAPKLDELLDIAIGGEKNLASFREKRKAFFQSSESRELGARKVFEAKIRLQEDAAKLAIAEVVREFGELFPSPREPEHLTQYDVAQEGGLYVHAFNKSLTMGELSSLAKRLKAIEGESQS